MRFVMAIAGAALLLFSCSSGPAPLPITKSEDLSAIEAQVDLKIPDQRAAASSVLVAEVNSPGYGWIVIRGSSEAEAGPPLGLVSVRPGRTKSLPVMLSQASAGSYVAYLYVDEGTKSVFECPGPDEPLLIAGLPFARSFEILN